MNITDFTIRLLLLFLPGLICAYLVDTFTTHKERKPFFFILQSFVYGFILYLIYWILIYFLSKVGFKSCLPKVSFMEALLNKNSPISFLEIIIVCSFAVIFSYIFSWILNKNIHFKIAYKLSVTNKFAEADVWEFTFNSKDIDEWVTVRDHKYNLAYLGWANAFSENSNKPELLLRDVSVYDNTTGERLYQIGCMYISRNREDITLEFGNIEISKKVNRKDHKSDKKEEKANKPHQNQ